MQEGIIAVFGFLDRRVTRGSRGRAPVARARVADQLARVDFLVLDELGYLPFARSGGQLLFHLVSRCNTDRSWA